MRQSDTKPDRAEGRMPPAVARATLGAWTVVAEAHHHALLRVAHLQWRAAQRLRAARSPAQALHLQADLLAEGLDTLALCAREQLKAWVDAHQAAVAAPRAAGMPPGQAPAPRRPRQRRVRPAMLAAPMQPPPRVALAA